MADDVFVICAIDQAHRAGLDATHAAVRAPGSSASLRFARLTLRHVKAEAWLYGARLTFAALRRRRQLLPWAEAHGARLLLSAVECETVIETSQPGNAGRNSG